MCGWAGLSYAEEETAERSEQKYTLLNGLESTVMNAVQLQEALFGMVTNNRSMHFTVTEDDGMTLVRVTRGVQG